MDILMLSKRGEDLDEGMKNFGENLIQHISADNSINLEVFDTSKPSSPSQIQTLIGRRYDIVHLIPGPSSRLLSLLKFVGMLHRATTVATCLHPSIDNAQKYLNPDIAFYQSSKSKTIFNSSVEFKQLHSGVDLQKFTPRNVEPSYYEDKFNISNYPVFLHVGHIKSGRNIGSLKHFTEFGEVLIIGSPSTNPDPEMRSELESAGCTVYTDYIEDIERVYNGANVYVFPTLNKRHSIQFPLSILEAMACDLPIISTKFGALPEFFESEEGIYFVEDIRTIGRQEISQIQNSGSTRTIAEGFDWNSVADTVIEVYKEQ